MLKYVFISLYSLISLLSFLLLFRIHLLTRLWVRRSWTFQSKVAFLVFVTGVLNVLLVIGREFCGENRKRKVCNYVNVDPLRWEMTCIMLFSILGSLCVLHFVKSSKHIRIERFVSILVGFCLFVDFVFLAIPKQYLLDYALIYQICFGYFGFLSFSNGIFLVVVHKSLSKASYNLPINISLLSRVLWRSTVVVFVVSISQLIGCFLLYYCMINGFKTFRQASEETFPFKETFNSVIILSCFVLLWFNSKKLIRRKQMYNCVHRQSPSFSNTSSFSDARIESPAFGISIIENDHNDGMNDNIDETNSSFMLGEGRESLLN